MEELGRYASTPMKLRPDVESVTLFKCECKKWVPFGRIKFVDGTTTQKIVHNPEAPHFNATAI